MFKYTFIALGLAIILFSSCGQKMKMIKTAKTDSLAVETVWKQYVQALSTKNTKQLTKLSLKQVYCQPCAIQTGGGDLVAVNDFVKTMLTSLPKTELWHAIKTSKHLIVTEQIKNYKPLNLNVSADALEVHDIWYVTRQPDKLKGFESQRYAFQFVKDGNLYKFFGLTAVN